MATFAGLIAAAVDASMLVLTLREHADRLSAALSAIQELDRLKEQLVQNVSHELRLPLMVIQSYADLLTMGAFGDLNPELKRAVDVISDKTAELGQRVGDIMLLRGLSQTDLQLEALSLSRLAHEAIERARPLVQDGLVVLVEDVRPGSGEIVADRRRLEQVIDELIENAIKFSPDGGEVRVAVREGGDVVYLKVSDQGIGIPAAEIGRIWDRFYQSDGSTTRRFPGTGVGLAVVKQIVTAHGGETWVESEEGQGSMFYVALRKAQLAWPGVEA
jgi:signal transduction histidine kinase